MQSNFTMTLKTICEYYAGEQGAYKDIIPKALPFVFDFDYPIFDEAYRNVLETKILKAFYLREIGMDTVGAWKLKLDEMLNRIMPMYNLYYESLTYKFNPLYDVDTTRKALRKIDRTGNSNSESTNTSESTADSRNNSTKHDTTHTSDFNLNKYLDTPQNGVNILLPNEPSDQQYLTHASSDDGSQDTDYDSASGMESHGEGTSTGHNEGSTNTTVNSVDDYIVTVQGYSGKNASQNLIDYRNAIINVDDMIIKELDTLFMGIWF